MMNTEEQGEYSLLYPVIDIFNHRFGAKVLWDMNDGNFVLSITEGARNGEQVFNNYAPKGNEERKSRELKSEDMNPTKRSTVLMGYGFCIPDNPCDAVTVRLGKPPEEVYAALRETFPSQFSSPEWTADSSTFFLRGSHHYSGGYPHEMPCLRGIQPELFHAVCAILSYTDSELNDEALVDATISAILDRLRDKRSAISRWDEDLPPTPQNMRQAYAKHYRDGQLKILNEVITELEGYFE